jgi:hypothetical protein
LLSAGAEVNVQGGLYGNPLQAAAFGGYGEVVSILLKRADPNLQGGYYRSALQAATSGGHRWIVALLLANGAKVNDEGSHHGDALQLASIDGDEKIVALLLEHGALVNAQGGFYGTALQGASMKGRLAIVSLLLKHGADVNSTGGLYGGALPAASYQGHKAVVELLLQQGADINAKGGYYGTALQAASCQGHREVVDMLMRHGAHGDVPGALHKAMQLGENDAVDGLEGVRLFTGSAAVDRVANSSLVVPRGPQSMNVDLRRSRYGHLSTLPMQPQSQYGMDDRHVAEDEGSSFDHHALRGIPRLPPSDETKNSQSEEDDQELPAWDLAGTAPIVSHMPDRMFRFDSSL